MSRVEANAVRTAGEARREVPYFPGGPETLLRVFDVGGDAGDAVGAMLTGPWTVGPDGAPAPGTLGVLADVVWGGGAVACAPPGLWGVSTEMTVGFGAPVPADGSRLTARGASVHNDAVSALATGTVHGPDGTLIAAGTQRTRFAPGAPVLRPLPAEIERAAAGRGIADLLGVGTAADDDTLLTLMITPALSNPGGILHGGIQFCVAELAASRAIDAARAGLTPSSVHVSYLRAGTMGDTLRLPTETLYRGRKLAVVQVRCVREDGKPCSVATVTYGPVMTSNRRPPTGVAV